MDDAPVGTLVLASRSARRAALLRAAGIAFDTVPLDATDGIDVEETPDGYARRLALATLGLASEGAHGRPILAATTVVTVDGDVLGVPADVEDARRMLRRLSGRDHVVMTAVSLSYAIEGHRRIAAHVERTTVSVAVLSDAELEGYVASGEPLGEAGGYAADGLGSRFVTRVTGSPSNVLGLPVAVVYRLLAEAGLSTR